MQNTDQETYLTTSQAAEILNVSLTTLKKFIYQGRIRTLKTPGGHHRILKSDLLKMTDIHTLQVLSDSVVDKALWGVAKEFINILEKKLEFSHGHSAAVAKLSLKLGQQLEFADEQLSRLQMAAFLHDIGKFWIKADILNKPSRLTSEEYTQVKTHPTLGSEILESMKPLRQLSVIVRQHHERFDGNGYPNGLKGEEISREARVIALADAFEVMTSTHSYKRTLSLPEAYAEVEKYSGTQFDPEVVKVFFDLYRKNRLR
ncbi:MAG: HD domain-containing protein [Candidatus Omnitrophica bacterium]|nr:HD domain-containing protein [Candidatus Omnitrophota bacterium]